MDPYELGFELAGICGVEPWGFTLRELYWMSWGRSNETWNHTASLMALLASLHADPEKGPPPSAATFHPYMDAPEPPRASPELLKAIGLRFGRKEAKHGG